MRRAVRSEVWKRAQTGHFETWAGYAEKRGAEDPQREAAWRALLEKVEVRAPIRPGERVLDIGCGLDSVLDFVPEVSRYTLDPLAARLVELGLASGMHHTAGVFEALPFSDETFDRVFCLNVLDHVRAPAEGLAEICRVSRPGAVLVLSVDTFAGRRYVAKRLHKWWGRVRRSRTKHPWVFSVPRVQGMLQASGFEPAVPERLPLAKPRRTLFVSRRRA